MDELEDLEELGPILRRIAKAANERGHASFFAVPPDDAGSNEEPGYWRRLQERQVVAEWGRSLAAEEGVCVGNVQSNLSDPPDCYVQMNEKPYGVEVTELVKGEILRAIAMHRDGRREYSSGDKFSDQEWTQAEFIGALTDRIARKDRAGLSSPGPEYLLIFTDEPELNPECVSDWLSGSNFRAERLSAVYLMLSYWPTRNDHYPVFRLV